jgi:hypothetical protein
MTSQPSSIKFKVEPIIPSAARTSASLRDIGYDTPRAIADLVDNSVAANASHVAVDFHFEGTRSRIRVTDNGTGMDAATLLDAMRYGSEREYSADDLGKFGFGLKTASTSQCTRVTVASRRAPNNAHIEVRCLDLGHIEDTNRWEVLVLEGSDRPDSVIEPLLDHTGTVVLWENLDRILEYKDPWGDWAKKKLMALAEQVDNHLGMVFHRFLAGEVPDRRLTIAVNGARVQPWDPFSRGETKTEELPFKGFAIHGDSGTGIVRVQPYVLPRQNEFSSDAAWRRSSGPASWNRQQGFYVYRAYRMIQSGGWNRMRTLDEHTKLARISIDFFPDLDSVFGINITKAQVNLPQELRELLQPVIAQVTRRADDRYRTKDPKGLRAGTPHEGASQEPASPRADPSSASTPPTSTGHSHIGGARPNGPYGSSSASSEWQPATPAVKPRQAIEDAAAKIGEETALERIITSLMEQHPEVARALGW